MAPAMLEELCKRIQHSCATFQRSRNKRNVGSCWLKRLTGFKHPTTCNRVCKRTQHVTSNNVGSCWPTMLRPFTRGLTPKSLQKNSFESARDMQEHSKRLSKNYIYIRSNIYYIKIYIHIKKEKNNLVANLSQSWYKDSNFNF